MKTQKNKLYKLSKGLFPGFLTALPLFLLTNPILGQNENQDQKDENIVELEEFIAEETSVEQEATLLPNKRILNEIYGTGKSLLDTPRSISVLTPEALKEFKTDNVYDIAKLVPGATVVNYYGTPGIPTTRGLFTDMYYNGMKRVWNRNGYPTSFGSLEAIDYGKGPPPGYYGAASPGGFMNFIPKSPYFDKFRGSAEFTFGSYDKIQGKVDLGGPTIIWGKPAAWRFSLTAQDAADYHENIKNNYTSAYASMKMKVNKKLSIFMGGEYYRHRANENPGFNRVTQDLIDNGVYITGRPLHPLTGDTVTFPDAFGGEVTVTNSTPGFVSREAIESTAPFGGLRGQFARLSELDLDNPFGPTTNELLAFLGGLDNSGNPDSPRFNGKIETTVLNGRETVIAPEDFANADVHLFFFDAIYEKSDVFKITNKILWDGYNRNKFSSYGYAEDGRNNTVEDKVLIEHRMPSLFSGTTFVYGGRIRFEDAFAATDFTSEPFDRQDISKPFLANSERMPAGGFVDNNGKQFWSPFGSSASRLITYGAFVTGDFHFGEKVGLLASGRIDHANWFDRKIPDKVDSNPFSPQPGDELPSGGKTYSNWSFSGTYKLTKGITGYITWQKGTSFEGYYVSGTVERGDTNFQQSELFEGGVKVSQGNLFASLSVFHQDLSNFDVRGGRAVQQRGRGVEFEGTWKPREWLTVVGNVTWQEHFWRIPLLTSGFVPLTPEQIVRFGAGSFIDFGNVQSRVNPGGQRALIPQWTASVYVRGTFGPWTIGIGPNYTDRMWGNPDKTFVLPSYVLVNGRITYSTEKWSISVAGNNINGARYFFPTEPFSSNAIVTKGDEGTWTVTFRYHF